MICSSLNLIFTSNLLLFNTLYLSTHPPRLECRLPCPAGGIGENREYADEMWHVPSVPIKLA
jgi:hypothetical protein